MIDVCRAQTWTCHEANADPDAVPDPHDTVSLWPDHPRFSAVVNRVQDSVAELVVGTSNSHPRAPDLGQRVDVHVDTLLEGDRWSLKSHAADVENAPEDPPLMTDGGQCVGNIEWLKQARLATGNGEKAKAIKLITEVIDNLEDRSADTATDGSTEGGEDV